MARTIEGMLTTPTGRFAVVVARFNGFCTERLLEGALDAFRRHGVPEDAVDVYRVPGAFEIPLVAKKAASTGGYAAVVCLGAVIRGATAHFDLVAGGAAKGVASASLDTGVPIIFGVLTTDTIEQAVERSGTKAGNHGYHAAVDALEMASLISSMES